MWGCEKVKKENKIKKAIKFKVLFPIGAFVLGTLLTSMIFIGSASTVMGFFGDNQIDETLSIEQNQKLFDELKNKVNAANYQNTYDERGRRIGKLCDYYGTDRNFGLSWAFVQGYLKYEQISSDIPRKPTIDDVKKNINDVVNLLSPKFTYRVQKITTITERKELQNQFDIINGLPGVSPLIKLYSDKPYNFSPTNYPSGTILYINNEDKTYYIQNQNTFKRLDGQPATAQNVYIYKTRYSWLYPDMYDPGDRIYINDENRTYVVTSNFTFKVIDGKPNELKSVIILGNKYELRRASDYAASDIIYVIEEDATYKIIPNSIGNTRVVSGKPSQLEGYTIYNRRPTKFDAADFSPGSLIYVISENKTYKVEQKEIIKREKSEQDGYFLMRAENIKGTYEVSYETETTVTDNGETKITITKPIISSINQVDKNFDNLREIIASRYKDEDLDKAVEGIVTVSMNFLGEEIDDFDQFFTGSGSFAGVGENFSGDKKEFIERVSVGAIESYKSDNILPSITIAQAILESRWGKSGLTQKANNLFGIKAFSSWTGPYVSMVTTEYDGAGNASYPVARFRAYSSWTESIKDHSKILLNNRYEGVRTATNYRDAAYALKKGGYATDPGYPMLIISLIESYGLYQYDKKI